MINGNNIETLKSMLKITEMVPYLKNKNIKFELISEQEAEKYLKDNNNYYNLTSYKHNFERYLINGEFVDKYVDLVNNDVQFGFKPYMFVYYGDINDIVKPDSEGDEQDYLGLYLDQLESINKKNIDTISSNLNDYISKTLDGNKNSFMGSIKMQEDIIEKKIALDGGALFNNNKLVNNLNKSECVSLNLLTKRINQGTFKIENPQNNKDFITLNVVKSVPNTKVTCENNKIIVNKNIDMTLSISEIQGKLKVNNNNKTSMELNEKIAIEKLLNDFYNEYTQKQIDILDLRRLVEEKYPDVIQNHSIQNIDLKIEVNLNIEGSNLTRNSL